MRDAAQVRSLDAIRDFRAAVAEFGQEASLAISEAVSDVMRTNSWIQHEQLSRWQMEIKKRNHKVAQAKADLLTVQLQKASMVTQKKALARAEESLAEAEQKIRNIKKWGRELDREMLIFRGQCQQLSRTLEADFPNMMAKMERMIDSLHAYVTLKPPPIDTRTTIESGEAKDEAGHSSATKENATGAAPQAESQP